MALIVQKFGGSSVKFCLVCGRLAVPCFSAQAVEDGVL